MGLEKITIDSKKGIGLVLSGGGAMGAYEAGVIKALDEVGIKFQLLAGTSVGALNAALVAADKIKEMLDIWENINLFKVLGVDPKSFTHGALLTNAPLEKMIREEIDDEVAKKIINSPTKLMIVSSCLRKKEKLVAQNFENREEIIKNLMASSAIPLVFQFELFTKKEVDRDLIYQLVDGGLITNFPIIAAAESGLCKTFFTTSLYTLESRNSEDKEWNYHDLMHVGFRALDIIFTNSYLKDISAVREKIEDANDIKDILKTGLYFPFSKKYRKIKNLYKKKKCEIYAGMQTIEINPKRKLPLDLLDFVANKTKLAVKMGYEDALDVLENVEKI